MNLADAFLDAARQHPLRPALDLAEGVYSYAALARAGGTLARVLLEHEGGGDLVAVFGARSLTAYSGILGALIAGKGYVPLNPRFPPERSLRMLELAGARSVVVGREAEQQWESLLPRCAEPLQVLLPDRADVRELEARFPRHRFVSATAIAAAAPVERAVETPGEALAYVLFTSGSTGEPKGVPIHQRNVLPYVDYLCRTYEFSAADRFSQSFDLTFDLSVHDMFVCWGVGGCLCVLPQRSVMAPAKFIRDKELTVWFSVPSVALFMSRMRMLRPGAFPALRHSLFCGEPLTTQMADAWQAAAPNSRIVNLYGPTEATIAILQYTWGQAESSRKSSNGIVAIGRAFPTQQTCIIDERRKPSRTGEIGELCLSGSQVTDGYLNNPSKTAEQFITIPELGPQVWYRTGDLVAQDEQGCHYYRGRLDNQVKIRGYRIELQEIDHTLQCASGSAAAISIAWPVSDGMAEGIVGFVFGACAATEAELLACCAERLPEYMVPARIVFLHDPPLNANGKIDRKQLAQLLTEKARGA